MLAWRSWGAKGDTCHDAGMGGLHGGVCYATGNTKLGLAYERWENVGITF